MRCAVVRWDDDVVFKNCARGEVDKKERRFINDTLRSDFHKKFMEKYIKWKNVNRHFVGMTYLFSYRGEDLDCPLYIIDSENDCQCPVRYNTT